MHTYSLVPRPSSKKKGGSGEYSTASNHGLAEVKGRDTRVVLSNTAFLFYSTILVVLGKICMCSMANMTLTSYKNFTFLCTYRKLLRMQCLVVVQLKTREYMCSQCSMFHAGHSETLKAHLYTCMKQIKREWLTGVRE